MTDDGECIEFVCLAISRRPGGRMVAGLRLFAEGWVRLVGGGRNGALSPEDCAYEDGTQAAVLDVISVPVVSANPEVHHPEDFLIDETVWWTKERPAGESDLTLVGMTVRREGLLLGSAGNRIPYAELERRPVVTSLALVEPEELVFRVVRRPMGTNLQARAGFRFGGVSYDLPITDILWEEKLKTLGKGEHSPAAAGVPSASQLLFCVSLGDVNVGDCYKLIAGVVVVAAPERR